MEYKNKRILFIGDSITALNTSDRGWVRYFNEIMEPSHFVNVAVSGARLANEKVVEFDGNPVFLGDETDYSQNVVLNQVERISRAKDKNNKNYVYNPEFENFDLIIIAAGTNDYFCEKNVILILLKNNLLITVRRSIYVMLIALHLLVRCVAFTRNCMHFIQMLKYSFVHQYKQKKQSDLILLFYLREIL